MAKIILSGVTVTIKDGRVRCNQPEMQSVLQRLADDIPSWKPEKDNYAAEQAVEQFGGRIIKRDPPQNPPSGDWVH